MKVLTKDDKEYSGVEVRLADNGESKIVSFEQALLISEQFDLNLVLMSDSTPPVVKMLDYSKELYNKRKKEKGSNAKTKSKEIKFHINIDKHDYQTKLNHVKRFLSKRYQVKITIEYRGREMAHKDIGRQLIEKIVSELEDVSKIESPAKEAGRRVSLQLVAK